MNNQIQGTLQIKPTALTLCQGFLIGPGSIHSYTGDGHPTFKKENPDNGYIYIETFIIGLMSEIYPYWIEIMGVDRPDRTYVGLLEEQYTSGIYCQLGDYISSTTY